MIATRTFFTVVVASLLVSRCTSDRDTASSPAQDAERGVVGDASPVAAEVEILGAPVEALAVVAEVPNATIGVGGGAGGALSRKYAGRATSSPEAFPGTEGYDKVDENGYFRATDRPLSTFSVDVDTASYANVRRFIQQMGKSPPVDAVRIEEMLNYFRYDDPRPESSSPLAVHVEAAECPWNLQHRLVRIGLRTDEIDWQDRPDLNLVFLVDVSGSMNRANKLPLLQRSLRMLVEQLRPQDQVAMVVYAGAAGVVLPPTSGADADQIVQALDQLRSGGSTHGSAGIQLAYEVAQQQLKEGGVNRVILATDGDFNVGVTDRGSLIRLIENQAKAGIELTVLGFGMGNLKDATLEQLADRGNGNYAYIDGPHEARKVLVEEMGGTLITVAKDVKIQVEFNPAEVEAYRLIGYENRRLAAKDFSDDKKDAGEVGAGHGVTVLYEVIPTGATNEDVAALDPLRYQSPRNLEGNAYSAEMLLVRLRYKDPGGDQSKLEEWPFRDSGSSWASSTSDFRHAAAVAAFGMLLRDSEHKGNATLAAVLEWGREGLGEDPKGLRMQFLELVRQAKDLEVGQ